MVLGSSSKLSPEVSSPPMSLASALDSPLTSLPPSVEAVESPPAKLSAPAPAVLEPPAAGASPPLSEEAPATPPPNSAAEVAKAVVTISWSAPPDATGFYIKTLIVRMPSGTRNPAAVLACAVISYSPAGASPTLPSNASWFAPDTVHTVASALGMVTLRV